MQKTYLFRLFIIGMWIRKESILYDKDSEANQFKKETLDEKPLTWNEFRILQSSKSKDLASEFIGDRSMIRQIGTKIKRRQLVMMTGHEFIGEIACYSIWLSNNAATGPITDALKGYNPVQTQVSSYDMEHNLPQLYHLRKTGGQLVTQYEHLSATWDCLISDNESKPKIGTIDPDYVTSQMELKLRMTSDETKGVETFKKRLAIIENETYEGYNPSNNFIDNISRLIW